MLEESLKNRIENELANSKFVYTKTAIFWLSIFFGNWMGGFLIFLNQLSLNEKTQALKPIAFSLIITTIAWMSGGLLSKEYVNFPLNYSFMGILSWIFINGIGGVLMNEYFWDIKQENQILISRKVRYWVVLGLVFWCSLWAYIEYFI